MTSRIRTALLVAAASAQLAACKDATITPAEHLADAYAEILFASAGHRGDTVHQRRILDSIAQNFGFDGQKEVLSEIHEVTLDPEVLRKVLDSTQNRLESLKQAKNEKGPK